MVQLRALAAQRARGGGAGAGAAAAGDAGATEPGAAGVDGEVRGAGVHVGAAAEPGAGADDVRGPAGDVPAAPRPLEPAPRP